MPQHAVCSYLGQRRFSRHLATWAVRAMTDSSGALPVTPTPTRRPRMQHREAAGGTVMTRMSIASAAALCLTVATADAQNAHFIVSAPSASVYKAPTNVSPVVGEAKQGAALEVTRDVGSWVKV